MTDKVTGKPVQVERGIWGQTIRMEEGQMADVKALLEAHQVPHWVAEESLSINGGPYMINVVLERKADPAAVQRLLDSVP
ncbi:MAG: hypothetical protein K2W96_28100 [Gemmataceae bacterium]|nr:hypothetical protein [Gemmataceae bacterium]